MRQRLQVREHVKVWPLERLASLHRLCEGETALMMVSCAPDAGDSSVQIPRQASHRLVSYPSPGLTWLASLGATSPTSPPHVSHANACTSPPPASCCSPSSSSWPPDLKPCLSPGTMRNNVMLLMLEQRPQGPDAVGRYAVARDCTPPSSLRSWFRVCERTKRPRQNDYKIDYIAVGCSWTSLDDASPRTVDSRPIWTSLDGSGHRAACSKTGGCRFDSCPTCPVNPEFI